MTHTLTITDLDDFEAEHVADILREYRAKVLIDKIDATVANDIGRLEWIEKHLDWSETVMAKNQMY